jgi:hypothetical protein
MRQVLLGASGILVLAFCGIVHGLWTDRWAHRSDLAQAAATLDSLPLVLGDWHGTNLDQAGERATAMAGTLSRRYLHRPTGKVVSIYIGCGRPGPVSVHTPEVCYAGSGYQVDRLATFAVPSGSDMPRGEFWTARFVKEKADGRTNLRLFWSWHAAGQWQIADNPRLAFAGERLLYKLYVIREMTGGDEPVETDPCVDFLRQLLPAMQSTYFETKSQIK